VQAVRRAPSTGLTATETVEWSLVTRTRRAEPRPANAQTLSMEDCRVARLRSLAEARPTEAARLNAEADAAVAARVAGQSLWGSELPELVLQKVLELLQWEPAVCGVIRATCSTWCSILDSLLPRLLPLGSAAVMAGKLAWYPSVTEVDLSGHWEWYPEAQDVSGVLAELGSMPSLRSLQLPARCAERAVDAEALCGLTTLTTLSFCPEYDEDGEPVEEVGEWVLDLSRLPTLNIEDCYAVTDKEVLALSNLPGLTHLNLCGSEVTAKGLRAVISLSALTSLNLSCCYHVSAEGLRAVGSLTGLTDLNVAGCPNVTAEVLRAVIK
jgi:hypothetical protein